MFELDDLVVEQGRHYQVLKKYIGTYRLYRNRAQSSQSDLFPSYNMIGAIEVGIVEIYLNESTKKLYCELKSSNLASNSDGEPVIFRGKILTESIGEMHI